MMNDAELNAQLDALLKGPPYGLAQKEKEARLLPLFQALGVRMASQCPPYDRFLTRLGRPPKAWASMADIPPLPVDVFKRFELRAVPLEDVVRELRSSSTTGQAPSRVFIDKATAFRQGRALASLLKDHIGGTRRPYLVLDAPESFGQGGELTARGAAIRGIGNFASGIRFAMRQADGENLEPDFREIEAFFAEHGSGPVLLFGFTFIVWRRFVAEAERRGLSFHAPQALLLHSGGWKKLTAEAVSKEMFSARTAAVLGCPPQSILDFYGMVEQVGTVFVDCPAMNKHAPAFADVLLRAPYSLTPVRPGEEGLIEVLSVLPTSYPGQALLTADKGRLVGADDCPCGRRGLYFRFTSRVERAEVRGCGDTFAQEKQAP